MINSTRLTITFIYKGKTEVRDIDRMYISNRPITDFYRIQGKLENFDIYKKDGIWLNVHKSGLSEDLLLVGRAIEEVGK